MFRRIACSISARAQWRQYILGDFHWYFAGIALTILIISGVVLNVSVFLISLRSREKLGRQAFLASVSLTYIIFLISMWFNQAAAALTAINATPQASLNWLVILRYISYPMMRISYTASLWLIICTLFERFFAVWYPYKQHWFGNRARAITAVICVASTSVVVNLPAVFEFSLNQTVSDHGNVTTYRLKGPENTDLSVIYNFAIRGLLHYLLPLVIIGGLNVAIVCNIQRKPKHNRIGYTSEQRSAIILMICAMFFVLCHLNSTIEYAVHTFGETALYPCEYPVVYAVMRDVTNVLLTLNTSSTLLVHLASNNKFSQREIAMREGSCSLLINPKTSANLGLVHFTDEECRYRYVDIETVLPC